MCVFDIAYMILYTKRACEINPKYIAHCMMYCGILMEHVAIDGIMYDLL